MTFSTALKASPVSKANPNFESICPVLIDLCVWAFTPGFTLSVIHLYTNMI